MLELITSLLCATTGIPNMVLCYLPFRDFFTPKKRRELFLIYTALYILSAAIFYWLAVTVDISVPFYRLDMAAVFVLVSVINICFVPKKLGEHLFTFGLASIVIVLLTSASTFINELLPPHPYPYGMIVTSSLIQVFFWSFYFPLRRFIQNTAGLFIRANTRGYWRSIWMIPVFMFLASFLAVPLDSYVTTAFQLISRIFMGAAALFICRSMAADYRRYLERESLSQQLALQKRYYDALTEKVSAERRARHDFKHQIAAIRSFTEAEDKNGLLAYCEELMLSQPKSEDIPFTGNAAADGVLYYYMSLAESEGIKTEISCSLAGEKMQEVELCRILGNALDNALDA